MIFVCNKCNSTKSLPTLSWETEEDPQISNVECLNCGFKWIPDKIKRVFIKGSNEPLTRKHTKSKKTYKKTTSIYKGVQKIPKMYKKPWRAGISVNSKILHLGYFATENEAGEAYNKAALFHYGEYANINIILKENI